MSRVSLLNSPLLLGFDQFERTLERLSKQPAEGYPPYNIERVGDETLRITLAVAGFAEADLDIRLEDNQLTISGQQDEADGRIYLHRGIAARQFRRSFMLAEGLEVTGALLDSGLLHIDLHRPQPRPQARKIEIGRGAGRSTEVDVTTEDV